MDSRPASSVVSDHARRTKKRRTKPDFWNPHKTRLFQYKYTDKLTNKEIARLMQENFGLDITERQLKHLFSNTWRKDGLINNSAIPNQPQRLFDQEQHAIENMEIDVSNFSGPHPFVDLSSLSDHYTMPINWPTMTDCAVDVQTGFLESQDHTMAQLYSSDAALDFNVADSATSSTLREIMLPAGSVIPTATTHLDDPSPGFTNHQDDLPHRISLDRSKSPSATRAIHFQGSDIEMAIPVLQRLESCISTAFTNQFGFTNLSGRVVEALKSEWLSSMLNHIMIKVFELSADVRRKWKASGGSRMSTVPAKSLDLQARHEQVRYNYALFDDMSINISSTAAGSLTGVLRPCKHVDSDQKILEPSTEMSITYLPPFEATQTAVTLIIPLSTRSQETVRIPPTLRTYNILPRGSEIFFRIQENDLVGVQELFSKGAAHPTDVDQWGCSLLKYTVECGGIDIFRLLLEAGADVQECSLGIGSCDVVTAIWHRWLQVQSTGILIENTSDICDYIEMTRLALHQGCEIPSGPEITHLRASLPFRLGNRRSCHATADTLYLGFREMLGAGVDFEETNHLGQTPLLHQSFTTQKSAVIWLQALMKCKLNVHATDVHGRGALHSVLYIETMLLHPHNTSAEPIDPSCHIMYRVNEVFEMMWEEGISEDEIRNWLSDPEASEASEVGDHADEEGLDEERLEGGKPERLLPWTHQFDDLHANDYFSDVYSNQCEMSKDGYPGYLVGFGNPTILLHPKLVLLLSHGCDPNVRDYDDRTPSDYVRNTYLWKYWEKALNESGWIYNELTELCEPIVSDAELDVEHWLNAE